MLALCCNCVLIEGGGGRGGGGFGAANQGPPDQIVGMLEKKNINMALP